LIYENRTIREFLKYLRIKSIVAKSQAKDEDIEKLSSEVKKRILHLSCFLTYIVLYFSGK